MTLMHGKATRFKDHVRSLTQGHFWLRYSTLAPYRAICAGLSAATGLTTSGAAHAERSAAEATQYVSSVFAKYKRAAGLSSFYGKVAEIGPGDSCGVGLMFLADGCTQVDLVDRYFSARDEKHQRMINREIVQEHPQLISLMSNDEFSEKSFANLNRHYGPQAAAETFFEDNTGYDFIVSCAVLEHVYDPLRSIASAATALKPGGVMMHQIDCRDHGQFSTVFHELKFLELSPILYSPLKWGGGPNRVRLSEYIVTLGKHPLDYEILVTSLAGFSEPLELAVPIGQIPGSVLERSRQYVTSVRDCLAAPFCKMADEDLIVTSFMIVAKKRA